MKVRMSNSSLAFLTNLLEFRDVKRRSHFQTENYMFEFKFEIATFDIWFKLALDIPGK